MSGGKFIKLNAGGFGAAGQGFKFYHGVAPNARIGSAAG